MNSSSQPRLRVRLTQKAESIIRSRHPWLYSDSIIETNREGQLGELAVLYDRKDAFLGFGLYDPLSPIRVRMLHVGKPQTVNTEWWRSRLAAARNKRLPLFGATTTGYRICHGENDGFPGLVIDQYDKTLVVKLYSGVWISRWAEVLDCIHHTVPCERVVLRLSRNLLQSLQNGTIPTRSPWEDGMIVWGNPLEDRIIFQENGIHFEADVLKGQKTGFFLDQRENRQLVGARAAGREVLNAFSFSGGFSLYAARGAARSVTDLDISRHALESASRNFKLNASIPTIQQCLHETVQADTFEWLGKGRSFDMVILDPPSFARREEERSDAIRAYGRLARLGIQSLRPGGLLVAASCSAHVSAEEFFGAVRHAAQSSQRHFTEEQTTGHPPDHPATFPEAYYLKCTYLTFSD